MDDVTLIPYTARTKEHSSTRVKEKRVPKMSVEVIEAEGVAIETEGLGGREGGSDGQQTSSHAYGRSALSRAEIEIEIEVEKINGGRVGRRAKVTAIDLLTKKDPLKLVPSSGQGGNSGQNDNVDNMEVDENGGNSTSAGMSSSSSVCVEMKSGKESEVEAKLLNGREYGTAGEGGSLLVVITICYIPTTHIDINDDISM